MILKQFQWLPIMINCLKNFKNLWDKKAERLKKDEDDTPDRLFGRAGIYSEFGKIICISVGFIKNREFRIKSYYGDDEHILLKEFSELLRQVLQFKGSSVMCP